MTRSFQESLFGKLAHLLLRVLPSEAELPILSGRLRGKKWVVGSSLYSCWLGIFELEKQRIFERIVRPGSIVFDLGGHVGFYTLLAAKIVGSEGCVLVFEPLPRNLSILRKHLEINGVENVKIIEAAVSDTFGMAAFDEGGNSHMGHLDKSGSLIVKTVCLDELVIGRELPIPDCLKIDIEGGEYQALLGAKRLLQIAHPTIFLATHADDIHEQCCTFLVKMGYRLKPIDGMELTRSREILAIYPGKE